MMATFVIKLRRHVVYHNSRKLVQHSVRKVSYAVESNARCLLLIKFARLLLDVKTDIYAKTLRARYRRDQIHLFFLNRGFQGLTTYFSFLFRCPLNAYQKPIFGESCNSQVQCADSSLLCEWAGQFKNYCRYRKYAGEACNTFNDCFSYASCSGTFSWERRCFDVSR